MADIASCHLLNAVEGETETGPRAYESPQQPTRHSRAFFYKSALGEEADIGNAPALGPLLAGSGGSKYSLKADDGKMGELA